MNAHSAKLTLDGMVKALTPAPTIRDLSRFARSRHSNFGWMLTAANVGDNEPVSLVKTRLTNQIPVWQEAARKDHWSARARFSRISAAKTILNIIAQFEGAA